MRVEKKSPDLNVLLCPFLLSVKVRRSFLEQRTRRSGQVRPDCGQLEEPPQISWGRTQANLRNMSGTSALRGGCRRQDLQAQVRSCIFLSDIDNSSYLSDSL